MLQELDIALEALTVNLLAGEHRSPAFLRSILPVRSPLSSTATWPAPSKH